MYLLLLLIRPEKNIITIQSKMKIEHETDPSLLTWLSKYQQNASSFIPAPEVCCVCILFVVLKMINSLKNISIECSKIESKLFLPFECKIFDLVINTQLINFE